MREELYKKVSDKLKKIRGGDFKTGINKRDQYDEINQEYFNQERTEDQENLKRFQKDLVEEKRNRQLESYNEQKRNRSLEGQEYRKNLMNQIIEKSNQYTEAVLKEKDNSELETILTALSETQHRGR